MSSDAGGRPEVKGMTGHLPAMCSRVWPRIVKLVKFLSLCYRMLCFWWMKMSKDANADGVCGQGQWRH